VYNLFAVRREVRLEGPPRRRPRYRLARRRDGL